jgi:hypothetical protein
LKNHTHPIVCQDTLGQGIETSQKIWIQKSAGGLSREGGRGVTLIHSYCTAAGNETQLAIASNFFNILTAGENETWSPTAPGGHSFATGKNKRFLPAGSLSVCLFVCFAVLSLSWQMIVLFRKENTSQV